MSDTPDPAEFDAYAEAYDEALERGISVSGEDKYYFARGRVAWVARRLAELSAAVPAALDFGCGTGSAMPFLLELLQLERLLGVDVSAASLTVAEREIADPRTRFSTLADFTPDGTFDLAFCNGVFHHIPPAARARAASGVYAALRPGGHFAFWENNPWNPGARLVMARIPFDRDAIMVAPPEARRLLRAAGFEIVRTDFLFVFPRALRWLRPQEARLAAWPLGAQYLVLARKPGLAAHIR